MESDYKTQLSVRADKPTYEKLIEIHRSTNPYLSLNQTITFIIIDYYEKIFKEKRAIKIINNILDIKVKKVNDEYYLDYRRNSITTFNINKNQYEILKKVLENE